MFTKAFVTLLAVTSVSFAAPNPVAKPTTDLVKRSVGYRMFTGDGYNWPPISEWATFDTMWANSQAVMSISCTQYGGAANNSPEEVADIKSAIISVSASSGVDPDSSLQSSCKNPKVVCNMNGNPITPCPAATITGMIIDGTVGTWGVPGGGDGLQQCLAQSGSPNTAYGFYAAARIYNSGRHAPGSDLGAPEWGTSCYASDVANRLLGWDAPVTPCGLPDPYHHFG
ncbi:hypothetical protein H4I96_01434 [Botrytis cinerea]